MTASSHGNEFRIAGPLWGKPPVTNWLPKQRVAISFAASLNMLLNKPSRCRRFKSSWCTCDVTVMFRRIVSQTARKYHNWFKVKNGFVSVCWQWYKNNLLSRALIHQSYFNIILQRDFQCMIFSGHVCVWFLGRLHDISIGKYIINMF